MILLVHGIYTENSDDSIGKLKKYVKDAESFDYGYITVLGALWNNNSIAYDLAKLIKSTNETVTIYAHSNGCAIAVIAAKKYGAKIENLICIGAALNRNIVFPETIKNILVLSTKKDKATKAARFFDGLPVVGWLVPDIWGSMGTDNYTGDDIRVAKVYLGKSIDDHSDYFSDEDLPKVDGVVDNWLQR